MRLCLIYATTGMAWIAILSLFDEDRSSIYPVTLVSVGALLYAYSQRRLFDVFVISALGLGANVLLISGLAHALIGDHGLLTGSILLTGCVAAGLLAGTVKLIMHLTRLHTGEQIA